MSKNAFQKLIWFLLLFNLLPIIVFCQDAQYWSTSFNPGSILIPGCAIAKNDDSGILTYNPALLAYNRKNAASISGNIYNLQYINLKNALGNDLPLGATTTSVLPTLASNTLFLQLKKPISIAYAVMSQSFMDFQATQRIDTHLNVLEDSYSNGKEIFVGQLTKSNQTTELSGMLAAGIEIRKGFSAGINLSVDIRRQTYLFDFRARAIMNNDLTFDQKLVTVSEYYYSKNMHAGITLRGGLAWELSAKDHLGITLTLPRIRILSRGEIMSDYIINNLKQYNEEIFLFGNSRQQNLGVRWKTPLHFAIGFTHNFTMGQLYVATALATGVKAYNVITPRNELFIRPDTAQLNVYTPAFLKLKDARHPVINIAIGWKYPISTTMMGYVSIRTDFNSNANDTYKDELGYNVNTANWNLYHAEVGANLAKRKFNLRAGILLQYGRTNQYSQEINFNQPSEYNYLGATKGTIEASAFTGGILLTYLHNF